MEREARLIEGAAGGGDMLQRVLKAGQERGEMGVGVAYWSSESESSSSEPAWEVAREVAAEFAVEPAREEAADVARLAAFREVVFPEVRALRRSSDMLERGRGRGCTGSCCGGGVRVRSTSVCERMMMQSVGAGGSYTKSAPRGNCKVVCAPESLRSRYSYRIIVIWRSVLQLCGKMAMGTWRTERAS